jgi:hypothetical protein
MVEAQQAQQRQHEQPQHPTAGFSGTKYKRGYSRYDGTEDTDGGSDSSDSDSSGRTAVAATAVAATAVAAAAVTVMIDAATQTTTTRRWLGMQARHAT